MADGLRALQQGQGVGERPTTTGYYRYSARRGEVNMEKVNDNVLAEIKKLGAFDLEACYSCGTCSAICPLSKDAVSFPRRLIRYAHAGPGEEDPGRPRALAVLLLRRVQRHLPAPGRARRPDDGPAPLRHPQVFRWAALADAIYSSLASVFTWLLLSAVALVLVLLAVNPGMNRREVRLPVVHRARSYPLGRASVLVGFIVLVAAIQIWILYRNLRGGVPVRRDRDVGIEWSLQWALPP
ncbi:MAG: hypothetical protein MZV70_60130 [Desulfobacterales bacterium]|nr:hypothetical protein [Desulfobacterales bacterium]